MENSHFPQIHGGAASDEIVINIFYKSTRHHFPQEFNHLQQQRQNLKFGSLRTHSQETSIEISNSQNFGWTLKFKPQNLNK
jgi:hypothetical protein